MLEWTRHFKTKICWFVAISLYCSLSVSFAATLNIEGASKKTTEIINDNPDVTELLDQDNLQRSRLELKSKLKDLLFAYGYFDSTFELKFSTSKQEFTAIIQENQQYTISEIIIDQPPSVSFTKDRLRVKEGDIFNGYRVQSSEKRVLNYLNTQDCRYIKRVKHLIHLDRNNKTLKLTFDIGSSPKSIFGQSTFVGIDSIKQKYLETLLTYKPATCFKEDEIRNTVKNAINTNLFNNVYYQIVAEKKDPITNIATVDVVYSVEERKHRTYEYGVGISDAEKLIVSFGNEWRNLLSEGASLSVNTRLSDISQKLNLIGRYPSYFGIKEDLIASTSVSQDKFETFDSRGFSTFLGYEKIPQTGENFSYGFGLRNSFAAIENSILGKEKYFLMAFPSYGLFDTRNDILRPTKGEQFRLDFTPEVNNIAPSENFLKNQLTASHYIDIGSLNEASEYASSVLAARATMGSIIGSDFNQIPLIERFYSGGGGSIRGYGYQDLGDLSNGRPKGGASLFEMSLEARLGIYQDYGLVIFSDAGNVYDSSLPEIGGNIQYSAGLGGRYYSDIVPVRVDVGVPLNPRNNRADNFGFYVGIGESF